MKVNLDLTKNTCTVTKEQGDPRFSRGGWNPTAESPFLYHVKQALIKQGYDLIKKRMSSDGCVVDDLQQWIRTRKWTTEGAAGEFALYNGAWAIYDLGEEFNSLETGEAMNLSVWNG